MEAASWWVASLLRMPITPPMNPQQLLEALAKQYFPAICQWVAEQERLILAHGHSLSPDQQIDAYRIGVKHIDKIRVMAVNEIPQISIPSLQPILSTMGLISPQTIGISFQYGIYLRKDYLSDRRLLVHEMTHSMQYERLGGIEGFLKQYVEEIISFGYQESPLEIEARKIEAKIIGD